VKILITGAAGFLGRYFLEYMMLQGIHDIWYMDKVQHPDGVQMDVADMEAWLDDFDQDVDLVIHMAGPVGGRAVIEGDPMFNADALRLDSVIFRWATRHAKQLIYPSSSAVYAPGAQTGAGRALQEGMFNPADPQWFKPDQMYGFTKLAGEVLAWTSATYGLDVLCIRPFSGYGAGQSLDYPVPSIALRAVRREDPIVIWGNGLQARDFLYVTDLVKWTMAIAGSGTEKSGYRNVNLGNGFPVSFADVARTCAEIIGYEPQIVYDDTKPKGVDRRWADTGRMTRMLGEAGAGYEPVTLREGLTRVIDVLRYTTPPYVIKK